MTRVEEVLMGEKKTTEMMKDLVKEGTEYQTAIEAGKLDILSDINMSLARIVDFLEADLG